MFWLKPFANAVLSPIAIGLIRFYQRFISPHKGFCCAYHRMTGKASCSGYALRVVKRYGVFALYSLLPRQFRRCHTSYLNHLTVLLAQEKQPRKKPSRPWRKPPEHPSDACYCAAFFSDDIVSCLSLNSYFRLKRSYRKNMY